MSNNDKLLNASLGEIKRGYTEDGDFYKCLLCEETTEKGVIYKKDNRFIDADKAMKLHIEDTHDSVFDYLINMDKKVTGLSEHQCNLMKLFHKGLSDTEVQKQLGVGSSSTIRNHRFILKEKERQAKIFLVLMELLKESDSKPSKIVSPHKTATMVDDRYNVTTEEQEKILKKYFPKALNGRLTTFSMKEKSKLVVLKHVASNFIIDRIYTEKEVNEILKGIYHDFATIRRYLIEYGFLDRKADGSQYWVKEENDKQSKVTDKKQKSSPNNVNSDLNNQEVKDMDRKKELIAQYKEMDTEAGIYQIKNLKNNKILVEATLNLRTINGKQFQLKMGSYINKQLQEDWNKYGEEAFVFEILEVLEEKKDVFFDKKDELKKLKAKWVAKLEPFGDRGYNTKNNNHE